MRGNSPTSSSRAVVRLGGGPAELSSESNRRRIASGAYVTVTLVLTMVYPVLDAEGRMSAFLAVSFSALFAVVVGLRGMRAGERRPWWLLLTALVLLNADNVVWYWYAVGRHYAGGDNQSSAILANGGQLFALAAALSLVLRRGRNDTGGLIDAAIVAMALGGLLWDVVILPHLEDTHAPTALRTSTIVGTFLLVGVLGALARILIAGHPSVAALWWLELALVLALSAEVGLSVTYQPGLRPRSAWTDMLLMGSYTAIGMFGLARSAAGATRPIPAPKAEVLSAGRLVFLGVALAVVPLVGGTRALSGRRLDGLLLITGSLAVTPLVMIRIGRLSAQRTRAEAALRHEAAHDALTGLANRREFGARLTRTAAAGRGLAVLFCDLDDFKDVNDRRGHAAGDRVLVEIAARLTRCVRAEDTVCRYGGDEFLILCPGADLAEASRLCHRIEVALSRPVQSAGGPVTVSASIGAVTDDGTGDAEDVIRRADAAMYRVKQARKA